MDSTETIFRIWRTLEDNKNMDSTVTGADNAELAVKIYDILRKAVAVG